MSREILVLAIDPATRGFGYAVLEGQDTLVDWGMKSVRGNKNAQCLRKIKDLIRLYHPDVLVLEDWRRCRRCLRVRRLIKAARALAANARVKACLLSRQQVKDAFATAGAVTKHQIALAIAKRFSELADRVPRYRRPWMSEDHRMHIFDAVALASTFFHLREARPHSNPPGSL